MWLILKCLEVGWDGIGLERRFGCQDCVCRIGSVGFEAMFGISWWGMDGMGTVPWVICVHAARKGILSVGNVGDKVRSHGFRQGPTVPKLQQVDFVEKILDHDPETLHPLHLAVMEMRLTFQPTEDISSDLKSIILGG